MNKSPSFITWAVSIDKVPVDISTLTVLNSTGRFSVLSPQPVLEKGDGVGLRIFENLVTRRDF